MLVELQEYIVEIDNFHLNILSKDYRENYFEYIIKDCNANHGIVYVAVDNNIVVGLIAGFVQNYDKRDNLDYACPKKELLQNLFL